MYTGYGSYNSPPAELSNNPFLEHSSDPSTRYPDISSSTTPTNAQFTSWIGQPNGVPQQQGYGAYNPQPTQQQYTASWGGSPSYQTQTLGYSNPPQQTGSGFRFQPSSSFGQQLSSAVDSGGFILGGAGYQQQPQQQLYGASTGYNTSGGLPGQPQIPPPPYQQTGVTGPALLSEFDPYASIGQGGWDGQQQPQQQSYGNQNGGLNNGGALNSQPDLHPREVIRKYKADLETWDTYSWKQLMNSLESLKKSWERRMHELDMRTKQPVWGLAAQQELAHYQNVSPPFPFRPLDRFSFRVTIYRLCQAFKDAELSFCELQHRLPPLPPSDLFASICRSVLLSIERSARGISPFDRPGE